MRPRSRLPVVSALLLAALAAIPACKKKQGDPDDPTLALRATPQAKRESQHRLRQIGLGMHSFNDSTNSVPLGIYGPDGKSLGLSWRVAILPYIEHESLYRQFKLDEPWDSPHNKKLIEKMPKVYAPPDTDTNGYTYLRSFSGKGALMDPSGGRGGAPGRPAGARPIQSIMDGSSNTLMVVEAAEAVPWTKPDELEYTPNGPLPKLGGVYRDGCNVLLCDGSVRWVEREIPPDTLRGLITKDGGEVVTFPGD